MTVTVKVKKSANSLIFNDVKPLGNKIYLGNYSGHIYRLYDVFDNLEKSKKSSHKDIWFHKEGCHKSTYANIINVKS